MAETLFREYHASGILLLLLVALAPAVCAASVSVEAGAASACQAGCSCMPESQAARLGYVPCSAGQSPCFHDSFGQPLYCFRQSADSCRSSCNQTRDQLEEDSSSNNPGSSGTTSIGAVIIAPPGTAQSTTTAPAANLFTQITDFFCSLWGIT